jgi:IclR family transcriptional regulator, blcABC operon repressor
MVTGNGSLGVSPAIGRAAAILTELAHGPTSMASLSERLRLSKSSVSDVTATLVSADLIRRGPDGLYRLGGHLSAIVRQSMVAPTVVDGFLRASVEGTDLDGHTLSLDTMTGNEVLTTNVRLGRHPLPLTPRPGTRTQLLDCAAGPAIASSLGDALERELDTYSAHQGIASDERAAILTAASKLHPRNVVRWQFKRIGQISRAIPGEPSTLSAVTLHLPEDPIHWAGIDQLEDALGALTDRVSSPAPSA